MKTKWIEYHHLDGCVQSFVEENGEMLLVINRTPWGMRQTHGSPVAIVRARQPRLKHIVPRLTINWEKYDADNDQQKAAVRFTNEVSCVVVEPPVAMEDPRYGGDDRGKNRNPVDWFDLRGAH